MRRMIVAPIAVALVAGALMIPSALGTPGPPLSIAALGSAVSAGTCTDSSCADRPQNSWSTGTNPAVASHRLRLKKLAHGIRDARFRQPIRAYTLASSRYRTVADLEDQMRRAVALPWRYATIDLGVGDLCAGTSRGGFRSELKRALAIFGKQLDPHLTREVLVPSIEDLVRHWRVLRADPAASRVLKAHRFD